MFMVMSPPFLLPFIHENDCQCAWMGRGLTDENSVILTWFKHA